GLHALAATLHVPQSLAEIGMRHEDLGRAAELVLQIVGERLRGLFPNDGTIASIGGTQFALLINETGAAADAFAAEA
ncbi:hypothetical protein SB822_61340, partial [Paraburkholderia sp. SIMBA_054]